MLLYFFLILFLIHIGLIMAQGFIFGLQFGNIMSIIIGATMTLRYASNSWVSCWKNNYNTSYFNGAVECYFTTTSLKFNSECWDLGSWRSAETSNLWSAEI